MEDFLLWLAYSGALAAQKLRKFDHITSKVGWKMKLVRVRELLEDRGLRL